MFSELFTALAAPFLLSLVTAAQSVPIVLPQDADYVNDVSANIVGEEMFTSDPTVAGEVLAVQGNPPATTSSTTGGGPLSVTIVRPFCVGVSGELSYLIILRNNDQSEEPVFVRDVTVIDTHPNMPVENIQPPPLSYSEIDREIIWFIPVIAPGAQVELRFEVPRLRDHVENRVEVQFSTQQGQNEPEAQAPIIHYELVSDNCQAEVSGEDPPEDFPTQPLPEDKLPAIICDPEDATCQESIPQLGVRFDNAEHYELNQIFERPVDLPLGLQFEFEEEKPELGFRFNKYASSTPIPGDCRVIGEEDIPGYRFLPDVQVTWCESGEYPERLIKGAPEPVKAKFGSIRLPDTSGLVPEPPGSINADDGVACRGLPGDPWWAADCSCQCGDFIFAPAAEDAADAFLPEAAERGFVVPCGTTSETVITRHDIFVTSQAECLSDGEKHVDPRF